MIPLETLRPFVDAFMRAEQRAESARRLQLMSGSYRSPKRSRVGTSDSTAFRKRVQKRRAAKGYR